MNSAAASSPSSVLTSTKITQSLRTSSEPGIRALDRFPPIGSSGFLAALPSVASWGAWGVGLVLPLVLTGVRGLSLTADADAERAGGRAAGTRERERD